MYVVPNPPPRAAIYSLSQIEHLEEPQMHLKLRDPAYDLARQVMLLPEAMPVLPKTLTPSSNYGAAVPCELCESIQR